MLRDRSVDFLIIGAPKAGTTSLFEYMRTHPDIHMPSSKEIAFFLDGRYERGLDWYLQRVLSGAHESALCGEASVRYMAGTPRFEASNGAGRVRMHGDRDTGGPETVIPDRIKSAFPSVKLICLLRDPVARCISEYRMAALTGLERRPFKLAVRELLDGDQAAKARIESAATNCYVAHGEYGRIIAPFVETFGQSRLLAIESSDLLDDPQKATTEVFRFLGVRTDFVPPNLTVHYRTGSAARRTRVFDPQRVAGALRRSRSIRAAWHALPEAVKDRLLSGSYKLDLWNRRVDAASEEVQVTQVDDPTVDRLREHYSADGEQLAAVLGHRPSWL